MILSQLRETDSAERKAGSGRARTTHTAENINIFDEFALSQEDAPQSYNIVT